MGKDMAVVERVYCISTVSLDILELVLLHQDQRSETLLSSAAFCCSKQTESYRVIWSFKVVISAVKS